MRGTVIDLGSSTFHVLIADADEYGIRNVVYERKVPARISESSPRRAIASLSELLERIEGACRIVATGDFRDNPDLVALAQTKLGIRIEVLSGEREAQLTWTGVSAELAGSHGRLAVIDLGGGSLECVWGATHVEMAHSMPLGVLRMKASSADEVRRRVSASSEHALTQLRAYMPETVVLSSGSARALLRVARRLGVVGNGQRHMWRRTFGELARSLAGMSKQQLMDSGVDKSRVDTISAGAIVFDTMLERLGRPVAYVARAALREGALIDLARRAQPEARRASV